VRGSQTGRLRRRPRRGWSWATRPAKTPTSKRPAALRQGKRGPNGAARKARPKGARRDQRRGEAGAAREGKLARPKQPRATGDPDAEPEELSRAGRARRSMQTSKRSAERDATQNSRSSDVRQDATHTGDTPDADLKRSVVQGVKEAGPDADLEEAGRGRPARTNRRRDAALSERGQPCGQTSPRAALEEVSRAEQVDDEKAQGKKRMARKKRMAESARLEAHGWRRMARSAWQEAHGPFRSGQKRHACAAKTNRAHRRPRRRT
jgi:hypothetical protein